MGVGFEPSTLYGLLDPSDRKEPPGGNNRPGSVEPGYWGIPQAQYPPCCTGFLYRYRKIVMYGKARPLEIKADLESWRPLREKIASF